jgi:hypothetical protein
MRLHSVVLLTVALSVGCSNAPTLKKAPVSVAGRVSRGGQPLGNVMVTFQPLDQGHLGSFAVTPDGKFSGELIAGNYSYYVGKLTTPSSDAALKRIDPKFLEADLERRILVEDGQQVLIALD